MVLQQGKPRRDEARKMLRAAAKVAMEANAQTAEARAALGPSIGTQGNLDPDLLRNGPIDAIERAAAEVLAAAKAPGGAHICNLGHGIMADTPEEHAEAFIRTVQAAGGR